MRIIKETNLYHCFAWEYDFKLEILDFCRYLKTTEGWKNFGFWEKKWRFSNPKIIDIIRERYPEVELDETATASLTQWKKEKEKELEAKERANQIQTKTISSLIVEGIKGELYNYQKTGIEFLINSNGRAIISDPMGSGKSCMSLGYVLYQKFDKILVVCPASVKFSWESETIKWTNLKSFIISSRTELTEEAFNKYQIFIINYDILKSHLPWLINHKFDALILDESQYVKSNTAIRTKLVKKIAYKINHRILLSGTPLLSRPVELFNSLSLIDPYIWNDWHSYTIRYCQGHQSTWGWDARGASNLDELRQRISHYFLRRKKEDILPELPPKRFIDFPVEMKGEDKFVYELIENSFIEYLQEIKKKNDSEVQRSLQAEKLVKLGELRQMTTKGKITAAEELIATIVDGGEKVIVYSCYNEPLRELYEKFKNNAVMLTGETPELFRKAYINKFQTDDNIKIFFGGTKSAGVGITLTAASTVVFLDFSWVPADHWQSVDRCHRIGQTAESITIYQLYAPKTIDEYMKEILTAKQEVFQRLMDEPVSAKVQSVSLIDDLLKKYQQ